MTPLVQTIVVAVIVAVAALYVARKVWSAVAEARRKKAKPGCGTDGCCK